jgi:hypothetical protein
MPSFSFPRLSGGVLVTVGTAVLMLLLFWPALLHPNHYFFQPGGDGIQSYFATAYYALYDGGQHFSGMNYPAGENFNYPNLQPLIAWIIWLLQKSGLPAASHTVGITNMLVLLSLAATPPVLYAILRRFRLPSLYAVVAALLIGFLSPQIQRIGDHMSLSYACFVPLLWYFIVRMQEQPLRARWYVLFGTCATLMALVMLYFLACGSIFLLAHAFVLSLRRSRNWDLVWRMVVAALVPLLLVRGWLWLTDPVTDRPPNPYGLLVYMTTLTGTFTPSIGPGQGWWQRVFHTEAASYEAMSYVGIVTTLTLVVAAFVTGLRMYHGRPAYATSATPASPYTALAAGGLMLLMALGIPMVLPGMAWVADYLGPLKQFRALGRFAWPFYYTATAFAVWWLWQVWHRQKSAGAPLLLRIWLPLVLLIWAGEAWVNVRTKAKQVVQGAGAEAFFDPMQGLTGGLTWTNRRASDFQAILPLPYFNKGSDRLDLDGSDASMFQAHRLAVTTGLPELSSYVSRPSMEQVLRHVQLLSGPLIEKPLLQTFPSRKPILLVVTSTWLPPAQQRLVEKSRLLLDVPQGRLYELTLDSLAATTLAMERQKFRQQWPRLTPRPNGLRATTGKGVLWLPFNDQPDRRGHLAPGAFHEPLAKFSTLYDGPLPAPADTGHYEVSVWVNGKTLYGVGNLQVKQYADDQQVDHQVADARVCSEISGEWLRMVVPIRVKAGITRLEVLYDSRDLLGDDLLIRPLDTDVYWLDPKGRPVLNGYLLQE